MVSIPLRFHITHACAFNSSSHSLNVPLFPPSHKSLVIFLYFRIHRFPTILRSSQSCQSLVLFASTPYGVCDGVYGVCEDTEGFE